MDRKRAQVMFVCIYVCIYVCMYLCTYVGMFFEDVSRLRALTEPKVVPYGRVMDNCCGREALLRHVLA